MANKEMERTITHNIILGFLKPGAADEVTALLKKYRPELFEKDNDKESNGSVQTAEKI